MPPISQVELEKIPTARDPWSVLSQTPGVLVDRINVGGNESGQQSTSVAPGSSDDENAMPFSSTVFEITDMAAIGASPTYYDFDQFTEMQFSTGGTDVTKNGRRRVGVNLVTKRGTNEFRGSARFLVTDGRTDSDFAKQSGSPIISWNSELVRALRSQIAASRSATSIEKHRRVGFRGRRPGHQGPSLVLGLVHGQNNIKNLDRWCDPCRRPADDTILDQHRVQAERAAHRLEQLLHRFLEQR